MSKTLRWSQEELDARVRAGGRLVGDRLALKDAASLAQPKPAGAGAPLVAPTVVGRAATPAPAAPNKYSAQKTIVDGIAFDSKREARVYEVLKLRKLAGEIADFIRQVSFPLSHHSRRRMRIDFLVLELDGRVTWLDAKGYATEAWKVKRDEVESNYPIKVELA